MLRDLEDDGALGRRGRKGVAEAGALPPVGVVDVVERDADGDLFVRLTKGGEGPPLVRLAPGRGEAVAGAPGLGDRLLVRFEQLESGEYEARLIKRLGQSAHRILGVVRKGAPRGPRRAGRPPLQGAACCCPHDDGARPDATATWCWPRPSAEPHRGYGPKRGKLLEVVGREDDPRAASLIAIHTHGIPTGFSDAAEAEAAAAAAADAGRAHRPARHAPDHHRPGRRPRPRRRRLRRARRRPEEPRRLGRLGRHRRRRRLRPPRLGARPRGARQGQQRLLPRPGRADAAASALSAGLCSLREGENRACMAVRMVFDADGPQALATASCAA